MKKIFFDTNILLDIALERKPDNQFAGELLSMADIGEIEIFVSSISYSHIFYTARKTVGKELTITKLKLLFDLVSTLPVDDSIIQSALHSNFKDFEDAIQYYCAIQEKNMGAIITNNIKDFSKADIPVMTAKTYLNLYAK